MQSSVQHLQLGDVDSQNTLYPIYSPRGGRGWKINVDSLKLEKLQPRSRYAVLTGAPRAFDCILHVLGLNYPPQN